MFSNKRGSHVGVIASFSIFILFLIAFFFIIEPMFNTNEDKGNLLEKVETQLINELKENLTTVLIRPASTNDIAITKDDVELIEEFDVVVKDKENNLMNFQDTAGDILIEGCNEEILWIYYSNVSFEDSSYTFGSLPETPEITSIRKTKEIFEEKIINAINEFDLLKEKINLNLEWSFSFEYENGTILGVGEKEISVDVFSKEQGIFYYDSKANKLPGTLRIKAW